VLRARVDRTIRISLHYSFLVRERDIRPRNLKFPRKTEGRQNFQCLLSRLGIIPAHLRRYSTCRDSELGPVISDFPLTRHFAWRLDRAGGCSLRTAIERGRRTCSFLFGVGYPLNSLELRGSDAQNLTFLKARTGLPVRPLESLC
jgi:hypothetical protein